MSERSPSFDQLEDQEAALTVPCSHCEQPAGEGCVTRDLLGHPHPLRNFPAHVTRLNEARTVAAIGCPVCGAPIGAVCSNVHGRSVPSHSRRKTAARALRW